MDFQTIIDQMGIELLMFAVCLYFGIRLIITRDIKILYKDRPDSVKNPREYCLYAGLIVLFLGVAALVMGILTFVNTTAAFVEIIVAVILLGIMWKFMHEKYA